VALAAGGRVDPATPTQQRAQRLVLASLVLGAGVALLMAPPRVTALEAFRTGRRRGGGGDRLRLSLHAGVGGIGVAARSGASIALACGGLAPVGVPDACGADARAGDLRLRAARVAAAAPPPPRPFFITAWCGPPLAELTRRAPRKWPPPVSTSSARPAKGS
jgi:hypothetical protein